MIWGGQGGQRYCRQKDYLGSPVACWGNYELSPVPGEKGTWWEVKHLRAQAGLVCCSREEGFLRPPLLSSIPGIASNRNVRRDAFPFHRAVRPAAKVRLVLSVSDPAHGTAVAFLFDVPSALLNYLCS